MKGRDKFPLGFARRRTGEIPAVKSRRRRKFNKLAEDSAYLLKLSKNFQVIFQPFQTT
jgi:hypothetical protein